MKNHRSLMFILMSVLSLSGLIFMYGCGSPTSGGLSTSASLNRGTISGNVYSRNNSTKVLSPIVGAVVSVSTEAMTQEVTTTTDASGKYTLRGLPSGTVLVSVSVEADVIMSIAANSANIDLVADSTEEVGTVKITGEVTGFPGSPSLNRINVYFLSGTYWRITTMKDSVNGTFEITGAPANDVVYVKARLDRGGGDYVYAYGKVDTAGGGTKYLVINDSNIATIEGTFVDPSGTGGYSIDSATVSITRNKKELVMGIFDDSVTSGSLVMSPLPALQSEDKYYVEVWANNANDELFEKFYYDVPAGPKTFDLSGYSRLPTPFMKFPAENTDYTGAPTMEWSSVPGANLYYIHMIKYDDSFRWYGYTNGTKITFPREMLSLLSTGSYEVSVNAVKMYNFAGLTKQDEQSMDAYYEFQLISSVWVNKN